MGPQRALNAVGVAAALMQCPADSFLGAGAGSLRPRVQPNGSATSSGATTAVVAVCSSSSSRGREDEGGLPHATTPLRPGLRRLAGWGLACGARGGHGNAEEEDEDSRRGDTGMGRSVEGYG